MPIDDKYLAEFEPGGFYHVYNRSHSGKLMFSWPQDFDVFFTLMKKHLCNWMDFYSYNLLSNHFHLFVQIKDLVINDEGETIPDHFNVSNQFRKLFIAYTNRYNLVNGFHGGLFTTPFRRILIDDDHYFTEALYYINHNAVHHKICKNISDYRYGSYNSLISDKPTILKRDEVFDWFGGKDRFIRYHSSESEVYTGLPFYYEDT